jgi:predicted phosphodiesterase
MTREEVLQWDSKYPDMPTRRLARIIVGENADEKYFEKVRTMLRYIRGQHGEANRSRATRIVVSPPLSEVVKKYRLNPYNIEVQDFVFPHYKPLILSDIHLPYHDLDALVVAVNKGIEMGCDSVLLNGDTLDFYQVSRFGKQLDRPSMKEEREMFWELIKYLNDAMDVPIFFKVGNHEERLGHYIMNNAAALGDISELSLEKYLALDELGVMFISGRQKILIGDLIVIHGHEGGESVFSPVNPARSAFLKYKTSTLAGHNHQTSSHFESSLKGEQVGCWSTGCLCQMTPEYRPFAYTKWNHGFAIVEVYDGGKYDVHNYRIKDNKVYT